MSTFIRCARATGDPRGTHTQAGVSDPMDVTHRCDRIPQLRIDLQPGESVQVLLRVMSTGQIKPMMELHTDGAWRHIERNHALLSGTPLFRRRTRSRDSAADTPQACCRSVP